MSFSSFWNLFPVPRYLKMTAVGFDISDQSLKYVELQKKDGVILVKRFGNKNIPKGLIEKGKILKREELTAFFGGVKESLGFQNISVNLPEEEIFLNRVTLPVMEESQLRNSIEFQLEEYIPISASEAVFDFEILDSKNIEKNKNIEVNLVATSKQVVNGYKDCLISAGLLPVSFETEAQALARAVVSLKNPKPQILVDFGKTRTGFAIVSKNKVLFASTINIAGDEMTKAIAKDFGVDGFEAERMKKEYGFIKIPDNEKFFTSLLPSISVIRDELLKHINYWDTHLANSSEKENKIEKIILCGGDANLIGFSEFLSYQLKLPVELGNPWVNVMNFDEHIPDIELREALIYSIALGLALRSFMD